MAACGRFAAGTRVDSDGDLLVDGIVVDGAARLVSADVLVRPAAVGHRHRAGHQRLVGHERIAQHSDGRIHQARVAILEARPGRHYNRTTSGGAETQNNAQFDVRNDWLLDENSPWTLFASGNVFYDEFQAFDVQTNANSGIGYRFVHVPGTRADRPIRRRHVARVWRAGRRLGAGIAVRGANTTSNFLATQKLYAKLDYFPEWEQFGEFRVVADAGWEIELVQPENLSLKISANDRYDSTPNGAEPHLVNYSVLLLLKL